MRPGRPCRDGQFVADFHGGQPVSQLGQHFQLPRRQGLVTVATGEFAGDRLAQRTATGMHLADGRDEIGIADALRDIALSASVDRRDDVILLLRRREHEHLRSGVLGLQVPNGVDAVHARHADIDNRHIGPHLLPLFQCRAAAGRLRRDHDAPRSTECVRQSLTKEGMVVHDHEPDLGHRGHR